MPTRKDVEKAARKADWSPIETLGRWGVRSGHAYTAGFASIGVALLSWLMSRGKRDSKAQSDRWGLFVGQWAPTFFALGIALKNEKG